MGLVDTATVVKLPVAAAARDAEDPPTGAVGVDEQTFWQHLAGDVAQWLAASIH